VRFFLTANGLLLPFIALQIYFHPLIWIAALWAVTFPGVDVVAGRSLSPGGNDRRNVRCDREMTRLAGSLQLPEGIDPVPGTYALDRI